VVHPKVPEIWASRLSERLATARDPELAVISLGRERVLPVFTECAERGIRHVIVISQGSPMPMREGRNFSGNWWKRLRTHGVRIIGPNTMGMLNAFADFSTAFVDIAKDPQPPPLTIVVQSGVFQVGFESFTGAPGQGGGCGQLL